jgi:predicted esterase
MRRRRQRGGALFSRKTKMESFAEDQKSAVVEQTVVTRTHGRYLVAPPASADPAPILVGFHGYGESADIHLSRLRAIESSERWLIVSIQGLHRFYQRRTEQVVASWMTRQDRELAISDNLAYVSSVLDAASAAWATRPSIVFAGFSQGVAMAFRGAVNSSGERAAVIAVGGDVPPEIEPNALARISSVLICRGSSEEWYSAEKLAQDTRRLRESGVDVTAVELPGGHQWSADASRAASGFLREWLVRDSVRRPDSP